jgi:hypothetical protein
VPECAGMSLERARSAKEPLELANPAHKRPHDDECDQSERAAARKGAEHQAASLGAPILNHCPDPGLQGKLALGPLKVSYASPHMLVSVTAL